MTMIRHYVNFHDYLTLRNNSSDSTMTLTKSLVDSDPILQTLEKRIESYVGFIDYYDYDADEEDRSVATDADVEDFSHAYYSWLLETSDKYKPLITFYNGRIDTITDGSMTENETRFNDTPNAEGNYNGTDYTTNITTSKSKMTESPLHLLDQLRSTLFSTYSLWVRDFDSTFVIYN